MYFSDEKAPEKRFKKILWLEPAWGVHQVSRKIKQGKTEN